MFVGSSDARVGTTWTLLVEALRGDSAELVDATLGRMRAELPSFHELSEADLRPPAELTFVRLLDRLDGRRAPATEDAEAFVAIGELRAAQGVSVDDMLAGWRFGLQEFRERARLHVPSWTDDRAEVLLELFELATTWTDFGMLNAAKGHRRASIERLREAQHEVANTVRRVLFHGATPGELRGAAAAYGLDLRAAYHAVRARPGAGVGLDELERFMSAGRPGGPPHGLVALVDGDVCGFVRTLPSGAAPAAVGAAPAVRLAQLPSAFRLATRAMETAHGLGARGVFDLPALGLQAAVLADHDVGQALLDRYVAPYERQGASGRVVLQTVERYLANDSRLEVTAQELGVHVNTVRYRLGRFEEQTGSSLRETEGLVEVWWALQRRRMA